MGCAQDRLRIRPGRNVWVLARTDRDAANKESVLDTAGAVLKRFLGRASPSGTRSIFEVLQSPKDDPHDARFVIGAARPVLVDAVQASSPTAALAEQPIIPRDERTDYFSECPTPRSVAAQRPWFVTVLFDWRAPTKTIAWPRRSVDFLGIPQDTDHGNDWLLLSAGHQGDAQSADTDLLDEVTDETAAVIKRAAKAATPVLFGLGFALGLGGIAWLVHRYGSKEA